MWTVVRLVMSSFSLRLMLKREARGMKGSAGAETETERRGRQKEKVK